MRPGNETAWSGGTLHAVAFGARQKHAVALRQTAHSGRPGGSLLASKLWYYVEFRIMVSQGLRGADNEALMLFRG